MTLEMFVCERFVGRDESDKYGDFVQKIIKIQVRR